MGKIIITEFVTLDGVAEDPGGSEGTKQGGWAFKVSRGTEGDKFKLDETMNCDALLLGRTTYQGFATAWPTRTGEFADKFNTMPKYVYSSTLTSPTWTNTTVVSGDLAEVVARLKQTHERDIVVHGSTQLAQALIDRELADEVHLMVFPLVLGTGRRLFGATADPKRLRLTSSQTVGDGVALLTYQPQR